MIGKKFYRNEAIPQEVFEWCMANNCVLQTKGDYDEIVSADAPIEFNIIEEQPTVADLVEALDILSSIVLGGE